MVTIFKKITILLFLSFTLSVQAGDFDGAINAVRESLKETGYISPKNCGYWVLLYGDQEKQGERIEAAKDAAMEIGIPNDVIVLDGATMTYNDLESSLKPKTEKELEKALIPFKLYAKEHGIEITNDKLAHWKRMLNSKMIIIKDAQCALLDKACEEEKNESDEPKGRTLVIINKLLSFTLKSNQKQNVLFIFETCNPKLVEVSIWSQCDEVIEAQ